MTRTVWLDRETILAWLRTPVIRFYPQPETLPIVATLIVTDGSGGYTTPATAHQASVRVSLSKIGRRVAVPRGVRE